jgi:hypothetical protein
MKIIEIMKIGQWINMDDHGDDGPSINNFYDIKNK